MSPTFTTNDIRTGHAEKDRTIGKVVHETANIAGDEALRGQREIVGTNFSARIVRLKFARAFEEECLSGMVFV